VLDVLPTIHPDNVYPVLVQTVFAAVVYDAPYDTDVVAGRVLCAVPPLQLYETLYVFVVNPGFIVAVPDATPN
jgi:hypothetical protein